MDRRDQWRHLLDSHGRSSALNMADNDALNELQMYFMNVTGVDSDRAKFHLESAAWDLQVALSSFYEEGDVEAESPPLIIDSLQPQPQPAFSAETEGADSPPPQSPPPLQQSQAPDPARNTAGAGFAAKYGSIYGIATKGNSSEEDEEEGQAFYAGGSERSGQQILGPSKNKSQDFISGMFRSAKQHGAETVDDPSGETASKKANLSAAFKGTGYLLGSNENESEVVASTSDLRTGEPRDVTLKMWQNGFSVDDGPLRDYAHPDNRDFLNSIRQGEIPMELLRLTRGGEVSLNMEDHRQEDYVRSKVTSSAFTGKGHLLGSPAPCVTTAAGQEAQKSADSSNCPSVVVNDAEPVTVVQIRLADGTRLAAKLNHTHTVRDLRRYIIAARAQYAAVCFTLMTTFPNRELTDDSVSLKDADLLNAVIVQRIQ